MIPINTSKKFNEHRPTLGPSFENIEFVPCWCFIFHELVEWFFINLYCYENVHPIHHNNQYVQIQTVTTHTICCINSARWWYELLQDPVQYICDWLTSELSKHLKTSYSAYHTHIKTPFWDEIGTKQKVCKTFQTSKSLFHFSVLQNSSFSPFWTVLEKKILLK